MARTKVQAIVAVMQKHGGQADLQTIYNEAGFFRRKVRASNDWQAGLRGVLYREIRNGQTFKKVGEATYALI